MMRQFLSTPVVFFCLSAFSTLALADPWFTGPIFAPAGHTIPKGHSNFELYGFDVFSNGILNKAGNFIPTPLFKGVIISPLLTHGFTDWLDVQLAVPYVFNNDQGQNSNRLADVSATLGLQLMEQKHSHFKPDLRLMLQEVFPTGSYERLNPLALGTDATGLGAYQTQMSVNFQYLCTLFKTHYLRTRLILTRRYSTPVNVHGFNSYGGTALTDGTINSGVIDDIDLAFEYTLTQNWVAVMEGYSTRGDDTRFDGNIGIANLGSPQAGIGKGPFYERGLAPALEYNFNANIGLIGGVWFPIQGINTSHFISYVLALNAYW